MEASQTLVEIFSNIGVSCQAVTTKSWRIYE